MKNQRNFLTEVLYTALIINYFLTINSLVFQKKIGHYVYLIVLIPLSKTVIEQLVGSICFTFKGFFGH